MLAKKKLSDGRMHRQARDVLARRIVDGSWPPGTEIPCERTLSAELGLSVGTVRRALDILESQGHLAGGTGPGRIVCEKGREPQDFTHLHTLDGQPAVITRATILERTCKTADAEEAGRLELEAGARVVRIRRLRYVADTPVIHDTSVYPFDLFEGLAEIVELPLSVEILAKQFGHKVGNFQRAFRSGFASDNAAEHLHLAKGDHILVLESKTINSAGRPIELQIAECDTRQFRYCENGISPP